MPVWHIALGQSETVMFSVCLRVYADMQFICFLTNAPHSYLTKKLKFIMKFADTNEFAQNTCLLLRKFVQSEEFDVIGQQVSYCRCPYAT